jgi:peptidoglycan L-alanyl-D-glutamate endopeptidase CwlK
MEGKQVTGQSVKKLEGLSPAAQPVFREFLNLLDAELGDDRYAVFEGRRTAAVQEAYYAQGREPLESVNKKRAAAGLYLLRGERDNYVITWTLKSKHIDGLAVDAVPVDGAGNPTWDLAHYRKAFEAIRGCGKKAGLTCGADWPTPDWPHYEI